MKKLLLLFSFISFSVYSQNKSTITSKDDKITFSEYDDLKYIKSILPSFNFEESAYRIYEDSTNSLFMSFLNKSDVNKLIMIYRTGTIEFISNSSNIRTNGTFKKNGNNRFLTLVQCTDSKCNYYVYVNNQQVYKGEQK